MDSRIPYTRPEKGAFIERFRAHLRALLPSDKLIASSLLAILIVLSFFGLYTLERQFLVEVPAYGGRVLEGSVGAPRFVNPLLAVSDADRDLVTLAFAGLMGYDAEGNLVPVLAEGYEISESGTEYTFRLREGMRFSDGRALTSEDVVFTLTKVTDPGIRSPRFSEFANSSAEAVDARTVRITLTEPEPSFLASLTLGIIPAHIWRSIGNEQFPFVPEMTEPVGAGPFKASRIARGRDGAITRFELSRFDDYALGKPYLRGITFVYFADAERLQNAIERGRVESAYGIPSERALRIPYSRVFGVFFNQGENPALMRLEVRRALSLSVNRDELVQSALGGYASPLFGPIPPTLLPEAGVPATNGEARDILIRDGWELDEEEGVWKHASAGTLRLTLTTSNAPELRAVAEEIRKEWAALSVPVTLEFYSANDLVLRAIRPREYEALLFGMVVSKHEDLFAFWHSSQRNDPGLNVAIYTNRSVDELLERLRRTSGTEEAAPLLERLNTIIREEYPAAFTHAPEFLYVAPQGVSGILLERVSSPSDRFVSAAFWYRHTEWIWPVFANHQ